MKTCRRRNMESISLVLTGTSAALSLMSWNASHQVPCIEPGCRHPSMHPLCRPHVCKDKLLNAAVVAAVAAEAFY
jgi:hypothetical protein